MATEVARRLGGATVGDWAVFSDADLWVEREVWEKAARQIADAMATLHERALPLRTTGALHVSASAVLFEVDDDEGA
ncbi:MAG: hypothetical protein U0R64_05530 [Candidatus Nanopelagicales bacterium]